MAVQTFSGDHGIFGRTNISYRQAWPGRALTNSLGASGGSVFRNLLGAALGALIRAAASTQTLSRLLL
jgi:hypothetical protein